MKRRRVGGGGRRGKRGDTTPAAGRIRKGGGEGRGMVTAGRRGKTKEGQGGRRKRKEEEEGPLKKVSAFLCPIPGWVGGGGDPAPEKEFATWKKNHTLDLTLRRANLFCRANWKFLSNNRK